MSAARVVGEFGYRDASVQRITAAAHVARQRVRRQVERDGATLRKKFRDRAARPAPEIDVRSADVEHGGRHTSHLFERARDVARQAVPLVLIERRVDRLEERGRHAWAPTLHRASSSITPNRSAVPRQRFGAPKHELADLVGCEAPAVALALDELSGANQRSTIDSPGIPRRGALPPSQALTVAPTSANSPS